MRWESVPLSGLEKMEQKEGPTPLPRHSLLAVCVRGEGNMYPCTCMYNIHVHVLYNTYNAGRKFYRKSVVS